jgi:spermidine/putrescine transport system permease protein
MVKKIAAKCFIYLVLFLMYVPILVLIVYSFTTTSQIGQWNNVLTFQLYVNLFQNTDIMKACGNTIILALIAAAVSTLLGTIGAIGTFYANKRLRSAIENVNQIPVVNAEIVIALSLTFVFVIAGQYIFRTKIFSFWTLLIGHLVLCAPFVYLNVKPRLQQLDPALYEAALDLGASPRLAMTKVMVPQLMPGILSGFMLSISLSLDDFIVTAFTRGPGLLSGDESIQTISTYIQGVIKKKSIPIELRALTTIIFIGVIVMAILITLYNNNQLHKIKKRKGRDY